MRMLAAALMAALIVSGAATAQIRPVPTQPPVAMRPVTPSPAPPPMRSPSLDPAPTPSPDLSSSGEALCSDQDVLAGRCMVVARLPRCPGDPRCPRPNSLNSGAGEGGPQP